MGDVLLDALLDSLKVLPFLILVYVLIEVIEHTASSKISSKLLRGKLSPLIGAGVGVIPQCGFSVVATKLYTNRSIALGTLLAVYISTSDEALAVLLSDFSAWNKLWPLLLIKVVFAITVGYVVNFFVRKRQIVEAEEHISVIGCHHHVVGRDDDCEHCHDLDEHEHHGHDHDHDHGNEHDQHTHGDDHDHEHAHGDENSHENHLAESEVVGARNNELKHTSPHESPLLSDSSAHEKQSGAENSSSDESQSSAEEQSGAEKKKYRQNAVKRFVLHPLLHALTTFLYVLAVNVVLGIIIFYVGEEALGNFMSSIKYLQPLLAAIVGLIPNCAASVVIAEMYALGTLSLGGAVSGLCVSAGIGLAVLIKENKSAKDTLLVIGLLFSLSVLLGACVTAISALF